MEKKFGILTVSDSCFNGTNEDRSGPNLKNVLIKSTSLDVCESQVVTKCVADEKDVIQKVLLEWIEEQRLRLILTTGGTGFSPRDVTPEATKSILDKETPGLVIAMMTKSLQVTEMAMLSRLTCGIRKNTLIINLPGSKKGSEECLGFVLPALPHALDLIQDCSKRIANTHKIVQSTSHTCPHGHIKNLEGTRTREDFFPVAKRPRHSPYPMLPVNEAIKIIHDETPWPPLIIEQDLADVIHSVLARDVTATDNLPPFPASIKDGYAVISSDGPGQRQVLKPITAGEESSVIVTPGTIARITTGAPLPKGSDAVVMVENTKLVSTSEDGSEEKIVEILVSSKTGQDIRPVGFDVKKGDIILEKGIVIGASEIGIAAGAGVNKLSVYESPRVAVLSTGNEVVEPGIDLKPGQIYDSNRYSILSMLKERNCIAIDLGIARDTRNELVEQIRSGLEQSDVLITTGGVSMGEKDLLKPVLVQDFDAVIHFGRVLMKPGKPTTFASVLKNGKKKLVFALPGNPVSAMVTFELFVFPALKKLAGLTVTSPTLINTKVTFLIQLDPRPEYHRVKLVWNESESLPVAMTTGSQTSSRLLSMKGANALLVLPPREDNRSVISNGETVQAMLMHRSLF